jgi:hypothetical protein
MKRHACCQYVIIEKYKVENQNLIGSKPKTIDRFNSSTREHRAHNKKKGKLKN